MNAHLWCSIVPDDFMLRSAEAFDELEKIRVLYALGHQAFARAIRRTPSAIKRFILTKDMLPLAQSKGKDERFAAILGRLETELHQGASHAEGFRFDSAGISGTLERIDLVLAREKDRGTFYNPNGILRKIDRVVFPVAIAEPTRLASVPQDRPSLVAGAKEWFQDHLERMGFAPQSIERYSDFAARIVQGFQDVKYAGNAVVS